MLVLVLVLVLVLAVGSAAGAPATRRAAPDPSECSKRPPLTDAVAVRRALEAGRDVWGERLLGAPNGPTYASASRYLAPLLYARGRGGRALTSTGVYYLAFAMPKSLYGDKAFALHVADGSEIITRRSGGPSLRIRVGAREAELYGACLARLTPARLAQGYLPILQTAYVDAKGVRYRQESFAGRVSGVPSLVSFVRLTVDTRSARTAATVRLDSGGDSRLVAGAGGSDDGTSVIYRVTGETEIYAAWVHQPGAASTFEVNSTSYGAARTAVSEFWKEKLGPPRFVVPEERVQDAQLSLLIQQQVLTWRYSIGNPYEELSFAEALDAAQVMASYGYGEVARAILRFTLRRLPVRYSNWRAGERLLAGATYQRLVGDPQFLTEELPELRNVVARLARQIEGPGSSGLLDREAYSSDIQRKVIALHGQIIAWQGLGAMARVWASSGHRSLAIQAARAASRLEVALRRAVASSQRRLPDGSLFVPAALLEGGTPFEQLTASREGSYWNLVTPYALASGFFWPHGVEARGVLRYLLGHGSRLLGLVRAGAYTLTGNGLVAASGTDQVYGLNVSRFLADNDEPEQLVLSLYGTLAAGMTPGTYISGEAASVVVPRGTGYRAMYLPPNGGTNSTFLETLRLMLVHETRGPRGAPRGLQLAFSTPRGWLADGKAIRVERAPTSFGPVSYSITRNGARVIASLVAPRTRSLRLRVRLPKDVRIGNVRLGGNDVPLDRATSTIDLSGRAGRLELVMTVVRR